MAVPPTTTARRLLMPTVVVGVLAWTTGQGLLPDAGLEWPERWDAVAAARGRQGVATALLFLAGCCLVITSGLLPRLSRAGRVGATLLGLGGVWLCSGRAAFNLQLLKATDLDRADGIAALSASQGPTFVAFLPTLLALLAAPVLLAVAARRTAGASWLPLGLWVVGMALFLAGEFQVKALEVAGTGLAGTGLILAVRALSRRC